MDKLRTWTTLQSSAVSNGLSELEIAFKVLVNQLTVVQFLDVGFITFFTYV